MFRIFDYFESKARGCRSGGSVPEPGAVACLRARLENAFRVLRDSGVPVHCTAFSGGEGYRRDEVSRLPRGACPHALFTLIQPRSRASKLAPATCPRPVPHIEPNVDPPSSKRVAPFNAQRNLRMGMMKRRPPRSCINSS